MIQKYERLYALDAFRGLTIATMILVNTPGSWSHIYAPLRHAPWHGCTPTDLVFPFFLFIVGAAMWFSFSNLHHEASKSTILKVIKRTFIIFIIGILLKPIGMRDDNSLSARLPASLKVSASIDRLSPTVTWRRTTTPASVSGPIRTVPQG